MDCSGETANLIVDNAHFILAIHQLTLGARIPAVHCKGPWHCQRGHHRSVEQRAAACVWKSVDARDNAVNVRNQCCKCAEPMGRQ
eukprot:8296114-Alexandrium_andersonii.AAC.1